MKYFLTITLCSLLDGTCVGPHVFPTAYPNLYSCQIDGYEKSVDKIKDLVKIINTYYFDNELLERHKKNSIDYEILETSERKVINKSYADNFK